MYILIRIQADLESKALYREVYTNTIFNSYKECYQFLDSTLRELKTNDIAIMYNQYNFTYVDGAILNQWILKKI